MTDGSREMELENQAYQARLIADLANRVREETQAVVNEMEKVELGIRAFEALKS
jgi:hypothetical protein